MLQTDRKHSRIATGFVSLALVLAACGSTGATGAPTAPSSSGQPIPSMGALIGPPITLKLAVADDAGSPSTPAVDDLVQQVAALSGGKITIAPTLDAGRPRFEQGVVELLRRGDADLALVGSRVWDLEGETSLRGLQAPFLVESDALASAIAAGDIGRKALDGLETVVGLAMWPEDLRHITQFAPCGHDLRTPSGFAGATVLVQPSGVSNRLLEALGADRYPTLEADRNIDALACRLHGMESAMAKLPAMAMNAQPVVLGDLTVFAKFQTLVANKAAYDRLNEDQRAALRQAAAAVALAALERRPTEAELATQFCAAGGSIIVAGAANLAAWEKATEPLVAELEYDAETKALIDAIRVLKASTPASPAAGPCDRAPQPTAVPIDEIDTTGYVGTTFPNGTFRRELVPDDLIAAGLDPAKARANEQVLTFTFDDGRFTFSWDAKGDSGTCNGTYESVDSTYVRAQTTPGGDCGGNFVWREEPGGISFIWLEPSFLPSDHIMLDRWVWTRIK